VHDCAGAPTYFSFHLTHLSLGCQSNDLFPLRLLFFQNSSCSKLRLVLQVPWLCPQAIAAARAPEAVPFYEYLTNLAASLTIGVPSFPDGLLCFMAYTYALASHCCILSCSFIAHYLYNNFSRNIAISNH
jgi:hypothetical protein